METYTLAFPEALKEAILKHYSSVKAASRHMGVSHTTLYDLVAGFAAPNLNLLSRIAPALPEEALHLYIEASLEPPASLTPGLTDEDYEDLMDDTDDLARLFAQKLGVPVEEVKRAAREIVATRREKEVPAP